MLGNFIRIARGAAAAMIAAMRGVVEQPVQQEHYRPRKGKGKYKGQSSGLYMARMRGYINQ